MPRNLKLINLILGILLFPLAVGANTCYPDSVGQRVMYEINIEMPKANLSGIMIMAKTDENSINASIVNEFGISIIDFNYNTKKSKVKIWGVMKKLDHWYIKRLLKSDIRKMLNVMQMCGTEYLNERRNIKYTFKLVNETTE